MISQEKAVIYLMAVVFATGVLVGYLAYPKLNTTTITTDVAANISTSTTTTTQDAPPINFSLPAHVDTLRSKHMVVGTVSQVTLPVDTDDIVDIVARCDTMLVDSSFIAAEYSYKQERFKFKLALKERVVTNTIKETVTVTNTVEKSGGIIFLSLGYGLVGNQEKFSTGFFIGIGYSIKLF
jgi:hypothetical protein